MIYKLIVQNVFIESMKPVHKTGLNYLFTNQTEMGKEVHFSIV